MPIQGLFLNIDNTVYKGNLALNNLHKNALIITKANYNDVSSVLHPYVKRFLKKALKYLK